MKRLLSLFLAICTVLSSIALCPMPVYAADTELSATDSPVQSQIPENEPQDISAGNILTETETIIPFEETLDDCKILQHVDADAFAQADHAFRMPELETMDTYVFQNNDGTRSVYYMNEAVKYTDSLGNIREKDLTLRAESRGYRMGENEFDLFLPFSIADGVTLTYEGYEVKLAPTGGNAPATVQNNAVVYDEYFGTGTSLRYTPMLSGVKEEIILDNYVPDRTFTFVLITDGLFLVENDGRYVLAEDKEGIDVVLYLGEILVYDALGKPSLGTISVETVKEGLGYTLTVAADEAFLSDPTTVYPVTIDPDLTVKDTASSTGLVEDATIFSGAPNTNSGSWMYLTAGYTDDTYKIGRALIRLPGLYNSTVYAGLTASDITSVKFYCRDSTGSASQQVYLFPCTSAWTESTVTWNSFNGAFNGTNMIAANMAPNVYTSYTITSIVKGWKNGTYQATAGFMLANFNESDVSKKKGPFASEYSNTEYRPYVVMTYTEPVEEEEETPTISFPDLSAHTLLVGGTYVQQVAVTPADAQLVWSSSNTYVATVDSTGLVRAKKAGITTIKARISGTTYSVSRTVYVRLHDGVYYFDNVSSGYRIELFDMDEYIGNEILYGWNSGTNAPTKRYAFFKVEYLGGGLYSIRSMLDNSMGWNRSGTSLYCSSIGMTESSLLSAAKWRINSNANGYFIYNNTGTSYTVTCGSSPGSAITLQNYTGQNALQNWNIVKLSTTTHGVTIKTQTPDLVVGKTLDFSACVYSTYADVGGQNGFTWSVTNGTGSATISLSGVLTGVSVGTVEVTATYQYSSTVSWSASHTVHVIPFEDGVYFFKNRQEGGYMQIDDADKPLYSTNGSKMELRNYVGEAHQRWRIQSLKNGYYRIISEQSGLSLSVPSGKEGDRNVNLTQETYDGYLRQQWQFIATSYGAYKIRAASASSDLVVCVNGSLSQNGANIQQDDYENNTSYLDEWNLIKLKDKAIVILPGGSGSSLQNEDGVKVWATPLVGQIACDENGESNNPIYPYNPDNAGVLDTYENLYGTLTAEFSNEYDIIFFAYDWRMTCADAADALQERLEDYSSCILVAHSMGGIVASSYLSKSISNRAKVEKLITLGTPFTGSAKALYVIETGNIAPFAGILLDEYALNIPAIYELLPTQQYYAKYDGVVRVNSIAIQGYVNCLNYMKTLNWAKKEDGTIKPMFDNAESFHASLKVNGTHAAELSDVDTYKIVGVGQATISAINYDSSGQYVDHLTLDNGDGTVLVYSALNNVEHSSEKTYYFEKQHTDLVKDAECLARVVSIIDGSVSSMQSTTAAASTIEPSPLKATAKTTIVTKGIESCSIQSDCGSTLYNENGKVYYNDGNGDQHCVGSVWFLGENALQYLLDGEAYTISEIVSADVTSTIRVDYCEYGLSESAITFDRFSENDTIVIRQSATQTTQEGVTICRSYNKTAD